MTVNDMKVNETRAIVGLGTDYPVSRHLMDLGLHISSLITIIRKEFGSIAIRVKDTTIGLDKESCAKIFVE